MHDAPFQSVAATSIEGCGYYYCMLNLVKLATATIRDAEILKKYYVAMSIHYSVVDTFR